MTTELLCTGVNVVSPQWVLRSAKQGSLQKLVAMSLDASRRLPADESAQHSRAAAGTAGGERQGACGAAPSAEVGPDRASREALLVRLLNEKVQYIKRRSCTLSLTLLTVIASLIPLLPASDRANQ